MFYIVILFIVIIKVLIIVVLNDTLDKEYKAGSHTVFLEEHESVYMMLTRSAMARVTCVTSVLRNVT